LGPVFGPDAAGFGPAITCVELFVPLEGPQLLEPYFPYRPIHKQAVYAPVVPIDAVRIHSRTTLDRCGRYSITYRRLQRFPPPPHISPRQAAIRLHRYIVCPLDIRGSPEIVTPSVPPKKVVDAIAAMRVFP
jgi:hypothetical protein